MCHDCESQRAPRAGQRGATDDRPRGTKDVSSVKLGVFPRAESTVADPIGRSRTQWIAAQHEPGVSKGWISEALSLSLDPVNRPVGLMKLLNQSGDPPGTTRDLPLQTKSSRLGRVSKDRLAMGSCSGVPRPDRLSGGPMKNPSVLFETMGSTSW